MKRVLLISQSYPPRVGGVAMAGYELAKMFSSLGYNVVVLARAERTSDAFDSSLPNVSVFRYDAQAVDQALTGWAGSILEECTPDLFVLNGWGARSLCDEWFDVVNLAISWSKRANAPFVYRSHGSNTSLSAISVRHPPFFGIPTFVKSILNVILFSFICRRHFCKAVFLSNRCGMLYNFDRSCAKLLFPGKVAVIPNTFNSVERDGCKLRADDRHAANVVFTCVATAGDVKGQKDAITALKSLDEPDARFEFICPKRNDYAASMEDAAGGDGRFAFFYELPRETVIQKINQADVIFLYSKQEQQPIVLLEAMSCGKPWICTNVGSVGDLNGGCVLKQRTPEELTSAVRVFMEERERSVYGSCGKRTWEENYSPPAVYGKWKKLLAKIEGKNGVN